MKNSSKSDKSNNKPLKRYAGYDNFINKDNSLRIVFDTDNITNAQLIQLVNSSPGDKIFNGTTYTRITQSLIDKATRILSYRS
jgi:hypothetical protein